MRRLSLVGICGALVVCLNQGANAQETKRVVIQGVEKNSGSCDKSGELNLEIFPDKIIFSAVGGSGIKETLPIDSNGEFAKEFRSPTGARIRIEGSVKTRKFQQRNLAGLGCVWEGTF